MKKILVTGAEGFVGKSFCKRVSLESEWTVIKGIHSLKESSNSFSSKDYWVPFDLSDPDPELFFSKGAIDSVVHLAAKVHVMNAEDAHEEYRRINTTGTERLARMAAAAGVRRFVFMSTVKVSAEKSRIPLLESETPQPIGAYAVSKSEAELALKEVARESGLEVVILRSPLVYGPGVRANFLAMMEWIRKGIPLPLGSIDNRRSLVFSENLADAIFQCATHPQASGETFFVSDGEDLSTPELISRLAVLMGRTKPTFSFPPTFLRLLGTATGKSASIDRLTESLTVDISKIRSRLGWAPPFSMNEGLKKTVEYFLAKKK
jgi:nucleoside-diphosphate-sugar epimerase